MTGTTVSALAFAALLGSAAVLEITARRRRGRGPAPASRALAAGMRSTPGRAAVLLGWVWLGLHFLAR